MRKMNSWPRSEGQSLRTIFEDNLLAEGIILQYTSKPERGYLFYNLPNVFYNALFRRLMGKKILK